MDRALAALAAGRTRWRRELADFVAIPSVSGEPGRATDVSRAARWLRSRLREVGMSRTALLETPGGPLVWAEWRAPRAAPTVLIYGHYDVVGPGPLSEWHSPPFAASRRGSFLYGRGASDDKGPLTCHLAALEAWHRGTGRLPVNVTCLFEGEEEVGSPSLRRLLKGGWRVNSTGRRADAVVISDTRMLSSELPTLIVGLRGGLAVEIEVSGPPRDLHSGAFGGAVRNPAQVLCELVAGLHDEAGRVAIANFYRDVRSPGRSRSQDPGERMASEQIVACTGGAPLFGESGFSAYERTTLRPALDVNGLIAGHTGPGAKSIVPARALAKLSFRLVPDQDPRRVAGLLREHVERRAPSGVQVRTRFAKPVGPVAIDPGGAALRAASSALAAGFGRPPVLLRSGGSIPVVELLATTVGDPVLMGFALPDDGMHGPNERVNLDALAAGARSLVHFLGLMGRPVPLEPARRRASGVAAVLE